MARGRSGRVVVDLDPVLKQELHVELAREGLTLKDWLTAYAKQYIANHREPQLFKDQPETKSKG